MKQYAQFLSMLIMCLMCGCAEPTPLSPEARRDANTVPQVDANTDETTQAPALTEQVGSTTSAAATSLPPPQRQPSAGPPPQSTTQAAPIANRPPDLRIKLRGVALGQTLPEGSAMGFSLDYEVIGNVLPSTTFEWVIESPHGHQWKERVTLERSGTLQTFVREWPVDPGIYTSYIQQLGPSGELQVISNRLDLPYCY